jgi:hypothetical protein
MDFKAPGHDIILLGSFGTMDATQFGSSQYAKVIVNRLWGMPPALDMA